MKKRQPAVIFIDQGKGGTGHSAFYAQTTCDSLGETSLAGAEPAIKADQVARAQ